MTVSPKQVERGEHRPPRCQVQSAVCTSGRFAATQHDDRTNYPTGISAIDLPRIHETEIFVGYSAPLIPAHFRRTKPMHKCPTPTSTPAAHPAFEQWLGHFATKITLVFVATLAIGLLLLHVGHADAGRIVLFLAIGTIVVALFRTLYCLYHADCPDCGGPMTTTRTTGTGKVVARCRHCARNWMLCDHLPE